MSAAYFQHKRTSLLVCDVRHCIKPTCVLVCNVLPCIDNATVNGSYTEDWLSLVQILSQARYFFLHVEPIYKVRCFAVMKLYMLSRQKSSITPPPPNQTYLHTCM